MRMRKEDAKKLLRYTTFTARMNSITEDEAVEIIRSCYRVDDPFEVVKETVNELAEMQERE